MRALRNIRQLILKELIGLWHDRMLLAFVLYAFTGAIYIQAHGLTHDLHNAAIGIVDQDNSPLSQAIRDALLPPRFHTPQAVAPDAVDAALDNARFTFILEIPPRFQADVQAGHRPELQLLIDATAIMQASLGANQIQTIVNRELQRFATRSDASARPPVDLQLRVAFNQGMDTLWFTGAMGMLEYTNLLAILLSGAALLREREHGTLEHLLVLPVRPVEIMLGKVLANGAVILVLVLVSLIVVLQGLLGMDIAGSIPLFLVGVALYLFFTGSLGIFLGTLTRSMAQLGLLFILVVLPMILLSGGETPLESMPHWLRGIAQFLPAAQFVAFAQALLYRGAGLDILWPRLLAITGFGLLFFWISAIRFRHFLAQQQ